MAGPVARTGPRLPELRSTMHSPAVVKHPQLGGPALTLEIPLTMRKFLLVLLALVLVSASIWTWTAGPCWLWRFEKAGNIPARCLPGAHS
jgi:hypothetical protein